MAGADSVEKLEDVIVRSAEQVAGEIRAAKDAISTVIFGQDRVVENTLVTILSGGHALLIGVPGLAKTKLVETLGTTLGLDAKRIQFTPDLMPSDILGAEVLDESAAGKRSFRFIAGPVFAQLLMADEINRASPRTQSALLQAMQEQHITVAGARHDLPKPFHVLATQNPLEQEGTYPLPEAQLDRFLMEIDVDYPDRDAERRILFETTGAEQTLAKAAMSAETLITAQRLVRRLPVGDSVVEAILTLVRSARPGPEAGDTGKLIAWGPGPRASQSLMLAVRARALLDGRLAPSIDDVLDLAEPVLKHRMALTFSARAEGRTIPDVIRQLKIADRLMAQAHGARRTGDAGSPARRRRKPHARRVVAAPDAGSPPHRRQRDPRPARPPPRRRRRKLLAVSPLRLRRAVAECRLAPLGARRSSLRPRAGMGGRAHRLAVAGPLRLDGLRVQGRARQQAGARADRHLRAGRTAGRRRRTRRRARADEPDLEQQRDRQDGAGDAARHARRAPACRRPSCRRRWPRSWCCRTSGRRSARSRPCWPGCRRPARTARWCRWSIRRKRASPIPAASNSSSRKAAA